jgi:RNA polymerase sigma-70 factor (ECF subfamily)
MELTDEALVAKARAGEADAFRALVERHSHRLFRLAYRMTGNQEDAEDVVQDSFLRAFRRLDQLDGRGSFGTWLYRIAANCSVDLLSSRKPRFEGSSGDGEIDDAVLSLPARGPSPERFAVSSQIRDRLKEAMNELSPAERAAFVLRHFEGMRIEEVGRALGCCGNAAKHSVFRAVHKLRRALEPLANSAR